MKPRCLFLASMLSVFLAASPASAALLGIQIVVQLNLGFGFGTVGTAFGGAAGASTPLDVTVLAGDTLRFLVQFDALATYNGFSTTINSSDPTEIDFVNGSGTDLSGKGFASFNGNPNNSLNDVNPNTGLASLAGAAGVTTQDVYRVDYLVTAPGSVDLPRDFTLNLTAIGSGNTINTAGREASVRINPGLHPEPSTLLLLGSGLAGLAAFELTGLGRRMPRK